MLCLPLWGERWLFRCLSRFGSVLLGEIDALGLEMPSICCVKSRRRFVVSSDVLVGVLRRRGVGEGDLEGEGRLRDVEGVGAVSRPGVRVISPFLVGLWPSFAKRVISGTSEKALKQVSSTLVVSGACRVELRRSRPAWNCEGVRLGVGSPRSKDFIRVKACGVVFSPLLNDFEGVFLGVLRIEGGGGGMRSESALPLRSSLSLFTVDGGAGDLEDLIDFIEPGVATFLGDALILVVVFSSSGTFSLSSMKSVKSIMSALSGDEGSLGVAAFSSIASNAMLPKDGLYCLLGLLLAASTSLTNGDEGGPSTSKALSSGACVICIDGESILCCSVYAEEVVGGRSVVVHGRIEI